MTQHDTKPSTGPSTALFIVLNGLGFLLLIISLIAILVMDPIHWIGVAISAIAGVYSVVLAHTIKRRDIQGR